MSQAPAKSLGTMDSCAPSIPALHRVQELSLEEKQLQLDQELRGYMNREGMQAVGRGRHGAGVHRSLVISDTDQATWSSSQNSCKTTRGSQRKGQQAPTLP